ncbi:pathogen-associated molecular patterns-induced protein A70-like [Rutidosis leptorrhynchoides]|uniref:pathogen-associated molecular patterns-induced protein A70-like n=1 Tax=Rutidosis leptorrhynchoides TaxID=125765 RepID=UPI003A996F04
MLGGGASMAIASIWTSIANWSTPTILFCVLNLMIATIFIVSNFKSHHHQSKVNHEYETTEYNSVNQLGRAPSLLQRLKSSDFSLSYFHKSDPAESEQVDNSTSQLTRAPSFLDRVKSFKMITSSYNTNTSQDEHSDMDPLHDQVEEESNKSNYNKLATVSSEKRGVTTVRRSASNLSKSRSEKGKAKGEEDVDKHRPATMRESVVHDDSVDAKADDFINRFKNQLKLQRIDSLRRFREMLNRGT